MHEEMEPKLAKWPFFIGNALFLGAAWFICFQAQGPLGLGEISLTVFCATASAGLGITPFLLEYRALLKRAEVRAFTSVVSQLQNLESVAAQISGATSQWQEIQQHADKTTGVATEIAERMSAEVKGFTQFIEQASDREKATLRLEVEKLRRAEAEWLQVLVRMLDHVYALHVGAVRSSQPLLIEQVGNFQTACRDVARKVGLTPFTAREAEPFDGQRHQLIEGDSKPVNGATIAETIAAGYTFQGKLLRPALVRLVNGNP